jgi:hypothetical protein
MPGPNAEMKYPVGLQDMVVAAHANAVEKGFYSDVALVNELHTKGVITADEYDMLQARLDASRNALVVSEVSEALEAIRKGDDENEAEELADAIIRICDYAGYKGIDLEEEVVVKMNRNAKRPRMHGGKRL